jgi:DNA-binding NarL/FixJ family response regulator
MGLNIHARRPNYDDAEFRPLTRRQLEILLLIAEGLSAKEMSFRLSVSEKTIEFHKKKICDRLDIHTTAGLTRYAIRHGLIEP